MTYTYSCATCGAKAEKTPTSETHSLGTWRCPKHGPTKVKRTKQ